MSLAAALAVEAGTPSGRPSCTVKLLLSSLDSTEADALLAAFKSEMTHAAISRALARQGTRITAMTIGRHRKHLCSCDAR